MTTSKAGQIIGVALVAMAVILAAITNVQVHVHPNTLDQIAYLSSSGLGSVLCLGVGASVLAVGRLKRSSDRLAVLHLEMTMRRNDGQTGAQLDDR